MTSIFESDLDSTKVNQQAKQHLVQKLLCRYTHRQTFHIAPLTIWNSLPPFADPNPLITPWHSIAEQGRCFQWHLFACQFVCLSTR